MGPIALPFQFFVLVVLSSKAESKTSDLPQCPAGTYWDNAVDRCEMCSQLCPYKHVQKLPEECENTCNPPIQATDSSGSLSNGKIGTIVLMAALVVTAVVAILVLLYKKSKKPLKFPQQETHDPEAFEDMPMRPEQETMNV